MGETAAGGFLSVPASRLNGSDVGEPKSAGECPSYTLWLAGVFRIQQRKKNARRAASLCPFGISYNAISLFAYR